MARGDYYDVWLRDETQARRVQATKDGSTVAIEMNDPETPKVGQPVKPPSPFITVHEVNKAGQPVRTFQFAKERVDVIEQGHETLKRAK